MHTFSLTLSDGVSESLLCSRMHFLPFPEIVMCVCPDEIIPMVANPEVLTPDTAVMLLPFNDPFIPSKKTANCEKSNVLFVQTRSNHGSSFSI